MDINEFSSLYKVRRINETDFNDVLKLMEGNPLYFKHCPPSPTLKTIQEDLKALPLKKEYKDKYYLGYFKNDTLIAIMDFIDKYPNEKTCFIGFFMMNIDYQKKGIGTSIISELKSYLKKEAYQEIRLGCIVTNNQAKSFWLKNNFSTTGIINHEQLYDVTVLKYEL